MFITRTVCKLAVFSYLHQSQLAAKQTMLFMEKKLSYLDFLLEYMSEVS